jgi:hypothetical protein
MKEEDPSSGLIGMSPSIVIELYIKSMTDWRLDCLNHLVRVVEIYLRLVSDNGRRLMALVEIVLFAKHTLTN